MTLQSQLSYLETSGLIKLTAAQPELEYLFRHALTQEAAYQSLLKSDRRSLHLAVGLALERMYPDQLASREIAPLLGQHYLQAGEDEKALTFLARAGDAAAEVYANAEAVMHYSSAIEIAQRAGAPLEQLGQLWLRRGLALESSSLHHAAVDNYAQLETLARERGDQALELTAQMRRATVLSTANPAHDSRQALALLDQAEALAHALRDRAAQAKLLWIRMLLNTLTGGDLEERIRYGEASLAVARELDLREQTAFTLHDLWFAYASAGLWDRTLEVLDEARRLWRELNILPALAENLSRTYMTHVLLGNFEQALTHHAEARHLSQLCDNADQQAISGCMIGLVHLERGQIGRAIGVMKEAIAIGETVRNVTVLVGTRSQLGWLYGLLGQADRGLALAQMAIKTAHEVFPTLRAWPVTNAVRLHLLAGNVAAAEAAIKPIANYRALMSQIGFIPEVWVGAALVNSQLALAKADYGRAIAVVDDLHALSRAKGARLFLGEALLCKGQALLARGADEAAGAALAEAAHYAEAVQSRRTLWPIFVAQSEIAARQGRADEHGRLLRAAREVIDYIAGESPPELRASFLDLPTVRTVLDS